MQSRVQILRRLLPLVLHLLGQCMHPAVQRSTSQQFGAASGYMPRACTDDSKVRILSVFRSWWLIADAHEGCHGMPVILSRLPCLFQMRDSVACSVYSGITTVLRTLPVNATLLSRLTSEFETLQRRSMRKFCPLFSLNISSRSRPSINNNHPGPCGRSTSRDVWPKLLLG